MALALFALVASCKPLPPDPVIRDGVDLGPVQSFEVERVPGAWGIGTVNDSAASDNKVLQFFSNATGGVTIELLTDVSGFVLRARGEQCKGWPEVEVNVDGQLALRTEVKSASWIDFPVMRPLAEGSHRFDFRFTNDLYEPPCDRNLFLDKVTFVNSGSISHGELQAVSMLLPGGISVIDDPHVPGGRSAAFMSAAAATALWQLPAAASMVVVRARGEDCAGPPELKLSFDQQPAQTLRVTATAWTDYRVPVALEAGVHAVSLEFDNDEYQPGHCDRNVYVDTLRAEPAAPVAPPLAAKAGSVTEGGRDGG